jgi:hypothetical protein
MYILGSVHIAAICAIKLSAIEVTGRYICVYILGGVRSAVMSAVKHSRTQVV